MRNVDSLKPREPRAAQARGLPFLESQASPGAEFDEVLAPVEGLGQAQILDAIRKRAGLTLSNRLAGFLGLPFVAPYLNLDLSVA